MEESRTSNQLPRGLESANWIRVYLETPKQRHFFWGGAPRQTH